MTNTSSTEGKKNQLAIISWKDAALYGQDSQNHKEVVTYEPIYVVSVGLIVYEDKDRITLAQDWFPSTNDYRSVSVYPKTKYMLIEKRDL